MELFSQETNASQNLLPFEGEVFYYGSIITKLHADHYLETLLHKIEWRHDEAVIFGRHIITKRMVAWYGDERFSYTYSNITKQALTWTPTLLTLKKVVEQTTGETYNSCLLNLYHDGSEGMAWHSDGEQDLKKNGAIASVSFGAARKFSFRHRQSKEKVSLQLEHGSILVMKGTTQTYWQHQLPPTKKVLLPRVNLTFRTIQK